MAPPRRSFWDNFLHLLAQARPALDGMGPVLVICCPYVSDDDAECWLVQTHGPYEVIGAHHLTTEQITDILQRVARAKAERIH